MAEAQLRVRLPLHGRVRKKRHTSVLLLAALLCVGAGVAGSRIWDGKFSTQTLSIDEALMIIEHPDEEPEARVLSAAVRARIAATRAIAALRQLENITGENHALTRQSAKGHFEWLRHSFEEK